MDILPNGSQPPDVLYFVNPRADGAAKQGQCKQEQRKHGAVHASHGKQGQRKHRQAL